jgi:hypothetical protein
MPATRGTPAAPAHPIPLGVRLAAGLWLAVWFPVYAIRYGWANFLHLSDIAVALTVIGLWTASPLLLSSQAVGVLFGELFWTADVAWRLFSGHHLIGGTEYLWDARFPLWLRLMTLYHLALPVVLVWGVARLGYDRRAPWFETAIAAVAIAASRWTEPGQNINFAFRDPFLHRAWGPAPVHLAAMLVGLLLAGILPAHYLLSRLFGKANG